jgi:virulence-associated protein VapD
MDVTARQGMSLPLPPFRSVSEELLYNIYLKVSGNGGGLTAGDIDTLDKLNSFLKDAVLMKADDILSAINVLKGNVPAVADSLEKLYGLIQGLSFLSREDIDHLSELNAIIQDADLVRSDDLTSVVNGIRGNVPVAGNSLEKLFNIIQGLTYLRREDIDTLAELNAIIQDADVIRTDDLSAAINALKGNVPASGNSLEKLFNIIQGLTFLKREDIDTVAELNAIISDTDLVRVEDLAEALVSLNLKRRSFQFHFSDDHNDAHHNRDSFVIRGRINSLSEDFTGELNGVTYRSRLDSSSSFVNHANLSALQGWINSNVSGNEQSGTRFWIKCVPIYKPGRDGEAVNSFGYSVL